MPAPWPAAPHRLPPVRLPGGVTELRAEEDCDEASGDEEDDETAEEVDELGDMLQGGCGGPPADEAALACAGWLASAEPGWFPPGRCSCFAWCSLVGWPPPAPFRRNRLPFCEFCWPPLTGRPGPTSLGARAPLWAESAADFCCWLPLSFWLDGDEDDESASTASEREGRKG